MSGRRPSRGAKVVYKEVDSSDDDDEFEFEKVNPGDLEDDAVETLYHTVYPPLTPLQLELRQLCRSGDKAMLKTFLVNNPEIDLDVRDPEAGTTALNEVATKTAQFAEIVEMLLQAGAGLEVTDGLGNTPLHNAVLYYPSTQHTVDMLLDKGADVSVMNYEGSTPVTMADDKDLKIVLRQLKKASEKKSSAGVAVGYSGSPDMRKMVFDRKLVEERDKRSIIVRYNSPVVVKSPGLLKRKREGGDLDESFGGKKKKIRFCEQDSTGADIDPQFSDEENETETKEIEENEKHLSNNDDVRNIIKMSKDVPTEKPNLVLTPETVLVEEKAEEPCVAGSEYNDIGVTVVTVVTVTESAAQAEEELISETPEKPSAPTEGSMSSSSSKNYSTASAQAECGAEAISSSSSDSLISSSPVLPLVLSHTRAEHSATKQSSILKFFLPSSGIIDSTCTTTANITEVPK